MKKNTQMSKSILPVLLCLMLVLSSFAAAEQGADSAYIPAEQNQEVSSVQEDLLADETVGLEQDDALIPAAEEIPAIEETPAAEEPPAEEEAPVVVEAPAIEETPVEEETPATEEPPAEEETPATEETPAEEETPVIEETPDVEETPAIEETPVVEEIPVIEESPAEEETPETEETPAAEEPASPYTYARDENGALVLDEAGNPVVTVEGDAEIPVVFERDAAGALVLDENGNPIPTQTVPADAVKVLTLKDVLNPNRSIDIYASWLNQEPALGGTLQFVAILHGYDGLVYSVQWQQSPNDITWTDVPEANGLRYSVVITEKNYLDYWRVRVTITGIAG